MFGDNVHEFLAPCIYEGEGEMLSMAFFKSIAKEHGQKYFEPIAKALAREKIKNFNPLNPVHAWKLRNELAEYPFWIAGKFLSGADKQSIPGLNPALQEHVDFALAMLDEAPRELSLNMVKHQLKLTDRQCLIADMSERVQNTITILITCLWAHSEGNAVVQASADILCHDLRRKITGERPTDAYFRQCSKVADMIYEQGYPGMEDIDGGKVLFPYETKGKEKIPTTSVSK
jgi:hypothetical protein